MKLDEIRQFLDGPAIVSLKGDEFAGLTGNGAIKRAVYDSYARVKWEVSNAGIGTVLLTKSGINDSMRHGYGRAKLAAFAAVPEVIQSAWLLIIRRTGRDVDTSRSSWLRRFRLRESLIAPL